ncbi:FAD-binding protein [Streptomyces sp. NPDC020965]|uniref:FAD-dependent oxidoreductase n=1 Tax=Streptomyces sp. NPDC020965 TaxID=3365105 RepID=UPI00378B5F5D
MYTHERPTADGRLPLPEALRPVTVRPGGDGFALLRHTYLWQGSPAAVVRVRGAEDIAAAVAHARRLSLPLAVRGGGHGVSGRSTNDGGLVVDLGRLNRVAVLDAAMRRVRVESGARWPRGSAGPSPPGTWSWRSCGPPAVRSTTHRRPPRPMPTATRTSRSWPRPCPSLEREFAGHWSHIRPHVNGIYAAFESGRGEELVREAFPEPTLGRLRKAKGRYDPDEVFNRNFPIPAARPVGDRRSPG